MMSVAAPASADPARPSPRRARARASAALAGALIIAAGLAVLWKSTLEDRLLPRRWGVVEAGAIYRSGQLSETLIQQTLLKHHIRVVVDLTPLEPANAAQEVEGHVLDELGIELARCPLSGDGTGDPGEYVRALAAIARARHVGQPVLIHCQAGSQRTGGVVAAWRLLVEGRPPEAVRAEMRRYGWRPERDRVLTEYLNAHLAEIASGLLAAGTLERLPAPMPRLPP